MARIADSMPQVQIPKDELKKWGALWLGTKGDEEKKKTGEFKTKKPDRFTRKQSVNFASFIDQEFAKSVAAMLGKIPVVQSNGKVLRPAAEDVVEWGTVRVIGGIRPQNFDVAYRPDGPRIAFDSKTLNDKKSVGKNWQNMVNDLATEAGTVHTRYPYAVITFMVIIPRPALGAKQQADIIRTLERLASRRHVIDQHHLAEAVATVIWDPATGDVDASIPPQDSVLRIERLATIVYPRYVERYKGLPPHDEAEEKEAEPGDDAKYVEDSD